MLDLTTFLGMKIDKMEDGLVLSQPKLIQRLLEDFNMQNCLSAHTPMEVGFHSEDGHIVTDVPYRSLICGLMYLAITSRPDLSSATSYLTRFLDKPTGQLWTAAKRILRYVQHTRSIGLHFRKTSESSIVTGIEAFSDSDFGGDTSDRKSNLKLALIEFARGRPIIWDRTISCTKKEREDAWFPFADGFKLQVSEVRKRWEGMRRMYFHELRAFLKSGKKSDWIYFSRLDTFLRKPVEALMEKFSVSKGSYSLDCIEISSNDEGDEPPATQTVAASKVAETGLRIIKTESKSQSSKSSAETASLRKSSVEKRDEEPLFAHSSASNMSKSQPRKSSAETASLRKSSVEKRDEEPLFAHSSASNMSKSQPRKSSAETASLRKSSVEKRDEEPLFAHSSASNMGEGKIVAFSFTGDEISIKPEVDEVSESKDSKPDPSLLLSRLEKQGEILVSKTVTTNEGRCAIENEAVPQKNPNTVPSDINGSSEPAKLLTTEEVRNELRKIPPIKISLKNCFPLKPKYPPENVLGGIIAKRKHRAVSSSNINSNKISWRSDNFRSAGDVKTSCGPASTNKARNRKPSVSSKLKPCPLSKKVTTLPEHPGTTKSSAPVTATYSHHHKKSRPSQDSAKGKESVSLSLDSSKDKESVSLSLPPYNTIAEDISEYATLNTADEEEEEVSEPSKKKEKSNEEGFSKFEDNIAEWRQEASKLSRNKSIDSVEETNLETVRESRKNFLLSFLPDMDEMSSEQRKFFKSKLMNLICLH